MKLSLFLSTSVLAGYCLAFNPSVLEDIIYNTNKLNQWNIDLTNGNHGSHAVGDYMVSKARDLEDPSKIVNKLNEQTTNIVIGPRPYHVTQSLLTLSIKLSKDLHDLFDNVQRPQVLCDADFQSKVQQFADLIVDHPHVLQVAEDRFKRDCDLDANDLQRASASFESTYSAFDSMLDSLSNPQEKCSN
ncbi:uncharacterized protein ATNIH1004_000806 [Aspergillus tanneri]|uniref:Uncharacterized protein n=1 Tax=Aspergillus tanneri TaxID=1220188 RepID=A0A5M9NBN0_9EURO|nr:uncharacterized protein ATNIH1004_000806 [Aspergillus tanneri]KAA8651907.1 hypothetical protein ATNIH1004_000806 [Aspergillus tanneri]